jgi:flagellar M-ring protein FliF
MAEMRKAIEQVNRFWQELRGRQRFLLLGGGALTLALLGLFVRQLATPTYKVLLNGLTPADAQTLAAQLSSRNIPNQIDQAGTTLSVPADQLDTARLEVASQGMPHSGRLGFEIFDKVSWGQTEFDAKVNYQRALEGELERTIQDLRDVEAARVHLVLPAESVFVDRQRTAKASVILKLRRGSLSPEAQVSIARLLSGAVDGLSPDNVAVIDADTNRPLRQSGHEASAAGGLDEQLTQRLLATLAPVVGPDHVRASVNVEFDPSTLEESQERYDPAATVTLSMQRSEDRLGGGSVRGVAGTSSNVPGAKPDSVSGAYPGDGNQNSKSESATYGVNKTVRHTSEPAGRIRRITAALLVDDVVESHQENGKSVTARKRWSPEGLKQVQELAQAALGLDAARGDLVSVQNISFDQPAPQPAPALPWSERIRTVMNDWSSVLRYGIIAVLFLATYALVIRPIKRQAISTMKELPAQSRRAVSSNGLPGQAAGLQGDALAALGEAPQTAKLLKKQVLDKVKHEPQSSSQLVTTWLREEPR